MDIVNKCEDAVRMWFYKIDLSSMLNGYNNGLHIVLVYVCVFYLYTSSCIYDVFQINM